MKLLILTQVVDKNDPVLGFMQGWITEFAHQCEKVTVICLKEGQHDLPREITVRSLGKEKSGSRLRYLFNFYRYIISERREYDAVFIHMNQIYAILGFVMWRFWNKTVSLWYAHGGVSQSLRLAEKLVDRVFTSTPEGFRIESHKLQVVGQGIDISRFFVRERSFSHGLRIVSVGRLSPIKDLETLIYAIEILTKKGIEIEVLIIGEAVKESDRPYERRLKTLVLQRGLQKSIVFAGGVPNSKILPYLTTADVFVNTSLTGSLDKSGLEAMATGLPVFTSNEAYSSMLLRYGFMFEKGKSDALAGVIENFMKLSTQRRFEISKEMREMVVRNHSLQSLVSKIISHLD